MYAAEMLEADLVAYLTIAAPPDMPWSQIRNLVAMRRAHGRPITMQAYTAIRLVLAAEEAGAVK